MCCIASLIIALYMHMWLNIMWPWLTSQRAGVPAPMPAPHLDFRFTLLAALLARNQRKVLQECRLGERSMFRAGSSSGNNFYFSRGQKPEQSCWIYAKPSPVQSPYRVLMLSSRTAISWFRDQVVSYCIYACQRFLW